MNTPQSLLLIGIHREELAFGQAVAEGRDPDRVALLTIPEGISGKRPQADQLFRYKTLHRALYLQLLPHILGRHQLLIDLHTGFDPHGPSADLISADTGVCHRLRVAIENDEWLANQDIRVLPLGADTLAPHARTVIPRQIWKNPDFHYVGMEIYLPETAAGREAAKALTRKLVEITVSCAASDH